MEIEFEHILVLSPLRGRRSRMRNESGERARERGTINNLIYHPHPDPLPSEGEGTNIKHQFDTMEGLKCLKKLN